MTTIHDLTAALGYALEHCAPERAAILKGFDIASTPGRVTPRERTGAYGVASATGDGSTYLTWRERCTCPAYSRHPETRCKHQWALLLVLAAELLHDDPVPRPSLAPIVCDPDRRHTRELAGFSGAVSPIRAGGRRVE